MCAPPWQPAQGSKCSRLNLTQRPHHLVNRILTADFTMADILKDLKLVFVGFPNDDFVRKLSNMVLTLGGSVTATLTPDVTHVIVAKDLNELQHDPIVQVAVHSPVWLVFTSWLLLSHMVLHRVDETDHDARTLCQAIPSAFPPAEHPGTNKTAIVTAGATANLPSLTDQPFATRSPAATSSSGQVSPFSLGIL